MDHPYTYIFVRTDIPFEQQLVQASHAALEAGFHFQKPERTSSIIMFAAKDQAELHEIAQRLDRYGIKHKMFYEPDFGPMGYSSLATEPIKDIKSRRPMMKYKLYKPHASSALPTS